MRAAQIAVRGQGLHDLRGHVDLVYTVGLAYYERTTASGCTEQSTASEAAYALECIFRTGCAAPYGRRRGRSTEKRRLAQLRFA